MRILFTSSLHQTSDSITFPNGGTDYMWHTPQLAINRPPFEEAKTPVHAKGKRAGKLSVCSPVTLLYTGHSHCPPQELHTSCANLDNL